MKFAPNALANSLFLIDPWPVRYVQGIDVPVSTTKEPSAYCTLTKYGTQTTQDNYRDSNGGNGAGAGVSLCRAKRMDTYRSGYILLAAWDCISMGRDLLNCTVGKCSERIVRSRVGEKNVMRISL